MATAGVAELALAVRAVGEVVTEAVATVHEAAAVAMGEVAAVVAVERVGMLLVDHRVEGATRHSWLPVAPLGACG